MSRRALARGGLAAGLIGLCVAGFFACFEKREIEIERGVSAEARRNPYLALGRMLERMGHTVVALSSPTRLSELPPPPATLILPTRRDSIGRQRSQALLDWVERGGHLVVVAYSPWTVAAAPEADGSEDGDDARDASGDGSRVPFEQAPTRPDPILDRFGLRQVLGRRLEREGSEDAKREEEPPALEDLLAGRLRPPETEASLADFAELRQPLEVGFSADYQWHDPFGAAVWSVAGPSGVHLVELRHGSGRISALTSDEPLANASIDARDNAEFVVRWLRRDTAAASLAQRAQVARSEPKASEGHQVGERSPSDDGAIWIFYDEDWPSLFALARRHALPAAIAGAVLLAAWVWSAVFRFGPVLPDPQPVRRAWLEHLDAAGRFHWRQDRGHELLSGLREEVARRLRERHPAWRRLADAERIERIAERAGLAVSEVEHALAGTPGGARAFTASVGALERIRAAL